MRALRAVGIKGVLASVVEALEDDKFFIRLEAAEAILELAVSSSDPKFSELAARAREVRAQAMREDQAWRDENLIERSTTPEMLPSRLSRAELESLVQSTVYDGELQQLRIGTGCDAQEWRTLCFEFQWWFFHDDDFIARELAQKGISLTAQEVARLRPEFDRIRSKVASEIAQKRGRRRTAYSLFAVVTLVGVAVAIVFYLNHQ
jgi:hypothetical protein